ncbi:MAG: hypothetical protein AAGD06_26710, partial [Acidobacteriota bacterium]
TFEPDLGPPPTPSRSLEGTMSAQARHPALETARVELTALDSGTGEAGTARDQDPRPEKVTVSCAWTNPLLRCEAPGGRWDAKLLVEGLAPVYFWRVELRAGETSSLGAARLVAGASVAGWVRGDPPNLEGLSLLLRRQAFGWQGDPEERRRAQTFDTRAVPDPRGFYQLTGLSAGRFDLYAELPEIGALPLDAVDLEAGSEAFQPIYDIERPAPLDFTIKPPVDPQGRVWSFEISQRVDPRSQVFRDVAEGSADPGGLWRSPPLLPGTYEYVLRDEDGDAWDYGELDHADWGSFLALQLDLVRIEGRLSMAGEPVEGTVVFGGKHGADRVELRTDEEGTFAGALPRRGLWPIDLETNAVYQVRLEPIEIPDSAAEPVEIEIEVPNTRVRGRVAREGQGVEDAFVDLYAGTTHRQRLATVVTFSDGSFEVLGLPEERIQITARHGNARAPWRSLDLSEDVEAPEVLLELSTTRSVDGRVTCVGAPEAGSYLVLLVGEPSGARHAFEATTGADGRFRIEVPEQARSADLLVTAPGCAARIERRSLEAGQPLDVHLGQAAASLRIGPRDPDSMEDAWLVRRGAAVELRPLRSVFLRQQRVLADAETGEWVLSGIEPGPYRICGFSSGCWETSTELGLQLEPLTPVLAKDVPAGD